MGVFFCPPLPRDLQLSNRFTILGELEGSSVTDPQLGPSHLSTVQGATDVQSLGTPSRAQSHCRPTRPPVARGAAVRSSRLHKPEPNPLPSTLIIGASIVRNGRVKGARTLFFSGATMQDLAEKVPDIFNSYPANDNTKPQSELLKRDFVHLFNVLKQWHSNVYVSGPTRSLGCLASTLGSRLHATLTACTLSIIFIFSGNVIIFSGQMVYT